MEQDKTEIYNNAENLINDLNLLTMAEIETKYETFKNKFPKLYQMCLTNQQNTLKELKMLLNIREDLKQKTSDPLLSKVDLIHHTVGTNITVSEHFAKRYVYPITGTPSKEQQKIAMKKIIRAEMEKMNKPPEDLEDLAPSDNASNVQLSREN